MGVEVPSVSWLGQLTVGVEISNNDERTIGKKNFEWDDGKKAIKNLLIITEIFQSVHET